MATELPQINVGRVALTDLQLKTMEATLYRMADTVNRLMRDGAVYTKANAQDITLGVLNG